MDKWDVGKLQKMLAYMVLWDVCMLQQMQPYKINHILTMFVIKL